MTARFVVAGPGTGVGKTTVVAALERAFARRGRRVRVFKAEPDYIGPSYYFIQHSAFAQDARHEGARHVGPLLYFLGRKDPHVLGDDQATQRVVDRNRSTPARLIGSRDDQKIDVAVVARFTVRVRSKENDPLRIDCSNDALNKLA